jgi:4'-phosphopantetheinyl transferase
MPLLQKTWLDSNTIIGIWQISEPNEDLHALLPAHLILSEIESAHPKRLKEWLASRVLLYKLLSELTPEPLQLQRDENGKPYFLDSVIKVSITHCPAFVAVLLSDRFEVGIDIELISDKALRIADRFLSKDELEFTAGKPEETCLYWSAKETLYKVYSRKKLILKENLIICPGSELNVLNGQIRTENFNKLYQIHYDRVQSHVLTYCIDK